MDGAALEQSFDYLAKSSTGNGRFTNPVRLTLVPE
jgi:hypothetical protein